MNEIGQRMADLSWAGVIPAVVCLGAGLLLWCAGRRVLRGALVVLGAGAGGLIGWALGGVLQVGLPAWVFACGGALLLGLVAWAGYRLALAGAMAVVLGTAAVAGVLTAAELGWDVAGRGEVKVVDSSPPRSLEGDGPPYLLSPPPAAKPEREPTSGLSADLVPFVKRALDDGAADNPAPSVALDALNARLDLSDETRAHIAHAGGVAQELLDGVKSWWESTPPGLRPTLIGAAIVGSLAGLLLGALAAGLSAMVLTAGFGAAMTFGSVGALLASLGGAGSAWMPEAASSWAALWLITTLLGLGVQWITRPKPADKSA